MIETVRDLAVLVAALAGAPVAVAAALRLPVIGKPAQYLAQVLVAAPLAKALKPLVTQAVEESDVLQEIDRAVNTRDPAEPTLSDDMMEVRDQVATITDRLDRGDRRFDSVDGRLGGIESQLAEVVDRLRPDD